MFKYFVLATLLFNISIFSAQKHKAQVAIDAFAQSSITKSASITFLAVDASDKSILAAFDPNRTLIPASTTKLWSTAAAFEILGSKYTPKTEIYHTGKITEEGVLKGDLIIKGFGDASLGSAHFSSRETMREFLNQWVDMVAKKNIKIIEGNILTDASALGYFGVPEGWTWSDMGNYYGAFPSGLTLFDNQLDLYFNTSSQKNGETTVTKTNPFVPGFVVKNYVKSEAVNSDNAYVFAAPYSKEAFVTGSLPLNKKDFIVKGAIQNSEDLLAYEMYNALNSSGIQIQGKPLGNKALSDSVSNTRMDLQIQNGTLIGTHFGKSLPEVAKIINEKSNNLFAEHLIHWLALSKDSNRGYHKLGMEILNTHWRSKIDMEAARITDGSGLSRSNSISAQHFVNLLYYMNDNADFEATLPVAGQSGTLKNLCAGQACSGKIKAKSGTINAVKAYAGYAFNKNGQKIIFALIVNNHSGTSAEITKLMESVLNALVS